MKLLSQTLKIGEMLVQAEQLTEDQLQDALRRQKSSQKRLGELLVEEGMVEETTVLHCLAEHLDLPNLLLNIGERQS